jgi:hypothetical protein
MHSAIAQAKEILLHPQRAWKVIEKKPVDGRDLLCNYVAPLAAVGPLAGVLGTAILGVDVPFTGRYRVPLASALAVGVARYVAAVGSVLLLALVIDALAPRFSGQRSRAQALKLAVYASTAAWIAGVFGLVPSLAALSVAGVYSVYLLYLGLPVLMKIPQERAIPFTLALAGCAFALTLTIGSLSIALVPHGRLS